MMYAYHKAYLDEIVETQGKLFDRIQEFHTGIDTIKFINTYMRSQTRAFIDAGQPYVCTMDCEELWKYFCKTDLFIPEEGKVISGFVVDWIGEFYAYFQWYYNIASAKLIELIPVDFLLIGYAGLHDLELDLAVKKVGARLLALCTNSTNII